MGDALLMAVEDTGAPAAQRGAAAAAYEALCEIGGPSAETALGGRRVRRET